MHLTGEGGDGAFPTTSWTLIRRIKSADAATAAAALDELCAQYHYPLYCYLRRRDCPHHDAQDVLHDFLARLCRVRAFERMDEAQGRLRGYLATALGRHLASWRKGEARREVPVRDFDRLLDFAGSAERYQREQFTDDDTPDRVFERKWALEIIRQAVADLAARYEARGRGALFAELRPVLESGGSLRGHDAPAIAARLGLSEAALRAALARLMRDYREVMQAAIRLTVEDAAGVDAELAYLISLFQR
jgi:RNA polymerase sigma-70 factor (ECF subfamily)